MNEWLNIVWLIALYIIIIPYIVMFIIGKIEKEDEDVMFYGLFAGISAYVISAIIFIVFSILNMNFREYEYRYTQDIVAVQDSETMLISRYSSDTDLYYYFMIENDNGYISRKVSQEHATIKYTESNPELKVYKKESTNKLIYFFMPIDTYVDDYKYEFYLPKGSIKEEFNIDLQ